VVFIVSSVGVRFAMLASCPILVIMLSMLVPAGAWTRLSTIVANPETEYAKTTDENLRHALESQMARQSLQKRAIRLALEHPLFGVGPLMFADEADVLVRQETGRKSGWQGTHNVYLQVASEAGIPALILYLANIVLCVTTSYRSVKLCRGIPEYRSAHAQSLGLLLVVVGYAINIAFCNVLFESHLSMLVGLTAANMMAIKREIMPRVDGATTGGVMIPPVYCPLPTAARG